MKKMLDAIDRRHIRLQCVRPGCKNTIGPRKARHHLCSTCSDAVRAPTSEALSWLSGDMHTIVATAPLCIPEVELPLSKLDIDLSVGYLKPADHEMQLMEKFDFAAAADAKPAGALYGFGVAGGPPMATLKSYVSNVRAIAARIFRRLPVKPVKGAWTAIGDMAFDADDLFRDAMACTVEPLSIDEWLTGFLPPRAAVLRATYERWCQVGRTWELINWTSARMFSLFCKREWLPAFEPAENNWVTIMKEAYKPRAIQAPQDLTHLIAGPMLRAITYWLKDRWHENAHIFYASRPPDVLDQWANDVVWMDASRVYAMWDLVMFDCTQAEESWKPLERLYELLIPPDWPEYEGFWKVMDAWRRPRGCARGKRSFRHHVYARYFGRPMMASGRDDTALANAIKNGIAASAAFSAALWHVPITKMTREQWAHARERFRLGVVGDDGLSSLPDTTFLGEPVHSDAFRKRVEENFMALGFIPKAYTSDRWQDIVFLGNRLYKVGGRLYWGPTLGRRLYKHHACIHPLANGFAWLHGVADMERRCFNHVPVLRAMANRTCQLLAGTKRTKYKWGHEELSWEREAPTPAPDAATYHELAASYNTGGHICTPRMIFELEQKIMAVNSLPIVLDDPFLRLCLLRDEM